MIIRRKGFDEERIPAASYMTSGRFRVYVAPTIDWSRQTPSPADVIPHELEFQFIGYEEYGREVLPVFEQIN